VRPEERKLSSLASSWVGRQKTLVPRLLKSILESLIERKASETYQNEYDNIYLE